MASNGPFPCHDTESGSTQPTDRIQRARELLADAGWLFDDFVNAEMRRVLTSDPDDMTTREIAYNRARVATELKAGCQSAFNFDPWSASNVDPFVRRGLVVALAPTEPAGVAEAARARPTDLRRPEPFPVRQGHPGRPHRCHLRGPCHRACAQRH